jgi:cytochrome bd-type quinol oxidase subunit 2
MKKRNALVLTVCGGITVLASVVFIIIGVMEAVERSEYQNTAMNTPAVVLVAAVFIAGAAAFIIGVRKVKQAK